MRARGHELFTPTYTGIGELTHPATRDVNLSTHVADIIGALEYEDLNDIVLVGNSYGGHRGRRPCCRRRRAGALAKDDGRRVQPNPMPPDTGPQGDGPGHWPEVVSL